MNFLKAFLSITGIVGSVQNRQTIPTAGSSLNLVPSHTTNLLPINSYQNIIPPMAYNSNSQQHTNLRGGNLFVPNYRKDRDNSKLAAVKYNQHLRNSVKQSIEPPLPTALPDGILTVPYFFEVLSSQVASRDCIVDSHSAIVPECQKQNVMPIVKHMLDLSTQKVIRVEHKQDFTAIKRLVNKDYEMIYTDHVGNKTIAITELSSAEADELTPIILTYGEELPTTEAPTTEAPTTTVPTTEAPTTTIPTTEIPTTIFTTGPSSTQTTETLQPNTTQTESTTTENSTELESSLQDESDFTEMDTEEPTEPDVIPAEKSNVGTIVGGIVGGLAGVSIVGAAAYYGYKKSSEIKSVVKKEPVIRKAGEEQGARYLLGEIQKYDNQNANGISLAPVDEANVQNKRKLHQEVQQHPEFNARERANFTLQSKHESEQSNNVDTNQLNNLYGSSQLKSIELTTYQNDSGSIGKKHRRLSNYYGPVDSSSNSSSRINSNSSGYQSDLVVPGSVNSNSSDSSTAPLIKKPQQLQLAPQYSNDLSTIPSASFDATNTECKKSFHIIPRERSNSIE